jgi:exopolyphosphatase/guanosine-5'-triphosphate,3'-diphosphate pyrophosphatase
MPEGLGATEDSRLAVVDLGSNSFRLVVFGVHAAAPGRLGSWWKRVDEIYEPVRIGAGVDESGALSEEGIARAIAAIEVFAHFCDASGLRADEIDAVATSAIREAANCEDFLEAARRATGLEIRVLSREEEARAGYLAAVNSTDLRDGAVLDLGGGSMQLVEVEGRDAKSLDSWRLGAVRMTERFLPGDGPATGKQLARLREHVAGKLERADWLTACGRRIVGVGGTMRNLAAAAQRAQELPSFGVQGFVIERSMLDELVDDLARLPPVERRRFPGIKPARGDIVLAGAVVIQSVLEAGGFDGIEATEAGLREGVFFERALAGRRPLLDDVRRASVVNLAAQYDATPAHTRHVARLALGLFDELADAGLHDGDRRERELLEAAALLHDIGVAVDYDDHHKHSRYLVLNAGLPGFSPREVALVGQIVRYHRKGNPDVGPFEPLMRRGDDALLTRCSVLLRLAEDLERSRDQDVREAHVSVDGEDSAVRLDLVADGEARVARWAASREVDLFERAFGRRLEVPAS